GLVISGGKYEIIIVGVEFLPDDGAFVRTGDLHLDDLVATHHLQAEVATVFVQLREKFHSPESSFVCICVAVVPHHRKLFLFYKCVRALGNVLLHRLFHLGLPVRFKIYKCLPFSTGVPHFRSVFCNQVDGNAFKPFFENGAVSSADKVYIAAGICSESFQNFYHFRTMLRLGRKHRVRHECAIVVKQYQPSSCKVVIMQQVIFFHLVEELDFEFVLTLLDYRKLVEEISCPCVHIILPDPCLHRFHSFDLFLFRHLKSELNLVGNFADIIRVNHYRACKLTCSSGHFTQQQHTFLVLSACSEFLCHEVHAVTQRSDQRKVTCSV